MIFVTICSAFAPRSRSSAIILNRHSRLQRTSWGCWRRPAAGQPPEPDDVAQTRAERTYYLGVLNAGHTAIDFESLQIDHLIDTIQDIRRKNFATRLLQPVPGIYSSQTWSRVPDSIPSATHRIRDIMTGWWIS